MIKIEDQGLFWYSLLFYPEEGNRGFIRVKRSRKSALTAGR
jgi:hypothetical protein